MPPAVYIPLVGITMGSIEVSNENLNIAVTVHRNDVHTRESSLSKPKGLRETSGK